MDAQAEYNGDDCVVLPPDYLNSVEAAAEIFEDELAERVSDLEVDNLSRRAGFFRGTFVATALWVIPCAWTVCL